jgi:U6 snRNA-associated Sm-like protein LSm8
MLKSMQGKLVSVMTTEGKHVRGILSQTDQESNLVLLDAEEIAYDLSSSAPGKPAQAPDRQPLGIYLLRGDSVAMVGLVDIVVDATLPDSQRVTTCPPLPPVRK